VKISVLKEFSLKIAKSLVKNSTLHTLKIEIPGEFKDLIQFELKNSEFNITVKSLHFSDSTNYTDKEIKDENVRCFILQH
jgi:hypothetical protein